MSNLSSVHLQKCFKNVFECFKMFHRRECYFLPEKVILTRDCRSVTSKEICFNIIWLAILNKQEPKNKKLNIIAWKKVKAISHSLLYETNIMNFSNVGLIFTPELVNLCKMVRGPRGPGDHRFWYMSEIILNNILFLCECFSILCWISSGYVWVLLGCYSHNLSR